MGTDAKLMIKSTGDKMYIDRKYNIDNGVLRLMNLDSWVSSHGLPVYLMTEALIQMRDMHNIGGVNAKFYDSIIDWVCGYNSFDYVRLVDENDEDY